MLRFELEFTERQAELGQAAPIRPLNYLDPRWGQERMIAALAGVPADEMGPFPV
jgi:hypothetical protein